jgi:hypothetical protein
MYKRLFILLLLLLFIGCGKTERKNVPPNSINIDGIREWAPTCNGYISKDSCDQGDVLAYAGYLCLVGEEIGCRTAHDSFDEEGRAWRNPKHEALGDGNSFSRDMLLGALYYFAATKDIETEAKFRKYVKDNGLLCPDAIDNRCEITPGMWGLWGEVSKYMGVNPTNTMKINMYVDDKQLYLQSLVSPSGYQRELIAMELVLRRYVKRDSKLLQWASSELYKKEAENPLYEYLEKGKSERFWELFSSQMPKEEPVYKQHWSIAKDHGQEAWKNSMGWEWIFLYNLPVY